MPLRAIKEATGIEARLTDFKRLLVTGGIDASATLSCNSSQMHKVSGRGLSTMSWKRCPGLPGGGEPWCEPGPLPWRALESRSALRC